MFNLLSARNNCSSFLAVEYCEANQDVSNPGRGWYRIYTFQLEKEVNLEEMRAVLCREEQLAMLQLDLGYYRNGAIEAAALEHLKQILEFFVGEQRELILRFLYDREGKGLEREPSTFDVILLHISQIGTIVKEYADSVLTLQGLLIGSWGEMHSSKFLHQDYLRKLTKAFYTATEGKVRLAVRRPNYLRMMIYEKQINENSSEMNIGLYNDGMLASDSDLGTYGVSSRITADWEEAWCREDELEFQNRIARSVINGGEVVLNNPLNDIEAAIAAMQRMHITYLHSLYDLEVLNKWKTAIYSQPGVFCGSNGYDYIGAHLGYRFYIKNAYLKHKHKEHHLIIEIMNTGFANAYEQMQVLIFLKQEDRILKEIPLAEDLRELGSNEMFPLRAELGAELTFGAEVWIQIKRLKDKKPIRLANTHAGEAFLLGVLAHTEATKRITKRRLSVSIGE